MRAPDLAEVLRALDAQREALLAAEPRDTELSDTEPRGADRDAPTRLIEAVGHGLDVGVRLDPLALRLTVRLLVGRLVARAPGRSVELRVPPYAAVQVVPGPRHTRGTPPAVVEADPVAWVEVATGRRTFSDAVAAGSIRASGGRSDLTAYLPLL